MQENATDQIKMGGTGTNRVPIPNLHRPGASHLSRTPFQCAIAVSLCAGYVLCPYASLSTKRRNRWQRSFVLQLCGEFCFRA
jgi:hypothetical protein